MKIYIDLTGEGCVGVCLRPGYDAVFTGTEIHREPAKYRGIEAARLLEEKCDMHFWFGDEMPDAKLYTVPKTEIGGYDSRGGLFLGCPDFGFREDTPLYYLSPERECFLITSDAREFRDMGMTWHERMVPSDAIACFPSRVEAQKKYDIKSLQDILSSDL